MSCHPSRIPRGIALAGLKAGPVPDTKCDTAQAPNAQTQYHYPNPAPKDKRNKTPGFYACIATMTLGPPETCSLLAKLRVARDFGFRAVELYWPDFIALNQLLKGQSNREAYLKTAHAVRQYCLYLGVRIVSLQPLMTDYYVPTPHWPLVDAWADIAHVLGVKLIGVAPLPQYSASRKIDIDTVVESLRKLGRGFRNLDVGFEGICFSETCSGWSEAYDVVTQVNAHEDLEREKEKMEKVRGSTTGIGKSKEMEKEKKNGKSNGNAKKKERNMVGSGRCRIILDTFNICANIFGNIGPDREAECFDSFACTLDLMKKLKAEDIGLVQVADGEQFLGSVDNIDTAKSRREAMKTWSRDHRCLPMIDSRACLPILDVLEAITDKTGGGPGYRGYVSLEIFCRPIPDVPWDLYKQAAEYPLDHLLILGLPSAYALWCAQRARESWLALCEEMNWQADYVKDETAV